ncbi:TonB-dependent receptor, partial [Pseudomonas sp. JAI120]
AVIGDIPPEQQLGPADIRSYGVSSVSELLTELAPQIRSDRGSGGAPVVLIDGKRISGFAEIRDLPTEAIARVDILPEEVALKYGYRADQKVVNFVLRRRFRAATVELSDKSATEGGRDTPQAELDLLAIANKGRVNLHLEYLASDALTESERDILPTTKASGTGGSSTSTVDQRPFRT